MEKLLDEDTVIKVLEHWKEAFKENSHHVSASDLSLVIKDVRELPPAQPEPSIPLSWIEGKIEWLNNMDNYFAELTANIIKTMLNEWRKGQTDNVD